MQHYIYSQINSIVEKFLLIKKLKSRLEFHVNRLLTLQICEPKLKPYISKEPLYARYLQTYFLFINFRELQKTCFSGTLVFANQGNILISCTLVFVNYEKTIIFCARIDAMWKNTLQ